tara:strand:- start:14103 stop:14333 length:231 start_codon:yes stop_codon:yes gene_type:complete
MRRDRLALVAPTGEHDRRPEGGQLIEVIGPVVDRVVENWAEFLVGTDAGVERVDQTGEAGFVDVESWDSCDSKSCI